jgi:hypothetical protein
LAGQELNGYFESVAQGVSTFEEIDFVQEEDNLRLFEKRV